ncbi:MAG: hypothetical protein MK101_04645 [Phycisphaerales bacterium]|nr:hypothetical protein [Phycisphaerales bacterium]
MKSTAPLAIGFVTLVCCQGGCHGPLGVGDLPDQEAALAEEGQADMRLEDGTAGAVETDSLTADGASGLGSDPFLQQQREQMKAVQTNTGVYPPGAAAILEPGVESETGDAPSSPGDDPIDR